LTVTELFTSEVPDGYIDVPLLADEQMVHQQTASYLVYKKPIWGGQLALTNQRVLFRPLDPTATSKMIKDGIAFLPDDLAVLGQVVDRVLDYSTAYGEDTVAAIEAFAISGVGGGMDASLLHPPSLVLTLVGGRTIEIGVLKSLGSANFWHANNTARDEMVAAISDQLVANGVA
jgi:hypothetical protein